MDIRPLGAALLCLGAVPAPAPLVGQSGRTDLQVPRAEDPPTASLGGLVLDARSGRPLGAAIILVDGSSHTDRSDANGRFLLSHLDPGERRIEIEYLGHRSATHPLTLLPGRHTELRLSIVLPRPLPSEEDVVSLPPLEVRLIRADMPGKLRGFYRRRRSAAGIYITREEIAARDPFQTSDLLRGLAGLHLVTDPQTGAVATLRGCVLQTFLDGVPVPGLRPDDIPPQDLGAIEIHRGPAAMPAAFHRAGSCGALVIWTRDPAEP